MKPESIKSVLVIKPGAMGDLLQLTPVLRALHSGYPSSRIDLLVGNTPSVDLFRHNPAVDKIWVYNHRTKSADQPSLFQLWQQIRQRSYDLVINFQRSNWRTWFIISAAFPCRLLIYHKTHTRVVHAVEDHLATIRPLGIVTDDLHLELHYSGEQSAYADQLWREAGLCGKKVVALNPGASHPVNRWSTRSFAELADMLALSPEIRVILLGGPDDRALSQEISSMAASGPLVLTGKTTLLQLGAVLHKCSLLVSGDTGPMHLATAVGTRVIALFGAADPERTGPVGAGNRVLQARDLACVPCRSRSCTAKRTMECMERISVEQVSQAVHEELQTEISQTGIIT
jgi:heptosyltransferase-2